MTAFTGFTFSAFLRWPDNHPNTVPLDRRGDVLYENRGASTLEAVTAGVLHQNTSAKTITRSITATRARGFVDDFYHRVHISPNLVDLGNMATVQTREVEVWNARLDSQTLSEIAALDARGMTLAGPESPAIPFGPLERRNYTLTVTPDGPASADALFRFDFSRESPALRVLVRRIVGWLFGPDWSEPVIEQLEWHTDVMESHSGIEQRARLRDGARCSFEYRLLTGTDNERVRMENRILSWQARVFGLPLWQRVTMTTEALEAGALVIPATIDPEVFVTGSLAGLVRGQVYEFAEITGIQDDRLHIKSPLEKNWPEGSRLYPVKTARLQNDLTMTYITDNVVTSRVRFACEEEWKGTTDATTENYKNLPVLLTPTDWRENIQSGFSRKLNTLDFMTGTRVVDDLSHVATTRKNHRFLLQGRARIARFRQWLAACAGKLNAFWLPAFQSDITLLLPMGAQDVVMTVEHRGFADSRLPDGRRDIMIATKDGRRFYRHLINATELSETREALTLDEAIGVAITPDEIRQITFMKRVRLDSDAVEIAHHTDQVAEVVLTLKSLKEE